MKQLKAILCSMISIAIILLGFWLGGFDYSQRCTDAGVIFFLSILVAIIVYAINVSKCHNYPEL